MSFHNAQAPGTPTHYDRILAWVERQGDEGFGIEEAKAMFGRPGVISIGKLARAGRLLRLSRYKYSRLPTREEPIHPTGGYAHYGCHCAGCR